MPDQRNFRRGRTGGMLDATLVCPRCEFRAPPGSEQLLRSIGEDTLVGHRVGPKVCVNCPVCGEGFRWLDPELVSVHYIPTEMLLAPNHED